MASVAFDSVTNYRASTDYGIDDSVMPLQHKDDTAEAFAALMAMLIMALRTVSRRLIAPKTRRQTRTAFLALRCRSRLSRARRCVLRARSGTQFVCSGALYGARPEHVRSTRGAPF